MPRVSRERAATHHAAIIEASSRLFRERGVDGVSVADLMDAAGLTHGGFYGHFTSKDALAAKACESAFVRSSDRWKRRVLEAAGCGPARASIIDGYLSAQSRDNPGISCITASLAVDVARAAVDAPLRAAFAGGVDCLIGILSELQESGEAATDRVAAMTDLSMLVGTMMLARATMGLPLSDEFLAAGRQRLLTRGAPVKPRRRSRAARD